MPEAKKQRVVIIGGTAGIGLATAKEMVSASSRYDVIITGRNQNRMEGALEALHGRAMGVRVDAADNAAIKKFFSECGTVDHVVIAPANHGGVAPFADITPETLDEGIDGKLRPHIIAAQAAKEVLSKHGSITLVSAITAIAAMPDTSVLSAINGAIASMVPGLAVELAPVRVNAVLPGVIDTDWWNWLPDDVRDTVLKDSAKTNLVGRTGQAEDVALSIKFLIENSFTTGVLLPCDGGARLVSGR